MARSLRLLYTAWSSRAVASCEMGVWKGPSHMPYAISHMPYAISHQLFLRQRPQTQAQGVDADKPLGVGLTVVSSGLEGRHLRVIERPLGLAASEDHVALVELEAHRAGDVLLRLVDSGLEH